MDSSPRNLPPLSTCQTWPVLTSRAGGQAPPELDSLMPWNLTAERRQEWASLREEEGSANTS
jgi:hypothetical protein